MGFAGFKAGGINIMTVDDRDRTPNFGKQFLNPSTVMPLHQFELWESVDIRKMLTGGM